METFLGLFAMQLTAKHKPFKCRPLLIILTIFHTIKFSFLIKLFRRVHGKKFNLCKFERQQIMCLILKQAYLHHRAERIRGMRWQFGAVLPPDVKANLCAAEQNFFAKYNRDLVCKFEAFSSCLL